MKEELKKATDYSEGQKTAAYMVLGEIVNLLNEFSDNIRIIGGWVPTLLYPDGGHIGSIDVDVLLNQLEIKKAESYRTIKRILTQNGYRRHEEKYFTFIKTIVLDGVSYDVDVDFLSGKYGGDGGNVSKHVDGIKTLPATGGNFAFDFPPTGCENRIYAGGWSKGQWTCESDFCGALSGHEDSSTGEGKTEGCV